MGTGVSLVFFALGAVLAFAVRGEPAGLDITAVGVIIMLASGIGLAWSVYSERWRHRVVEESIEQGNPPPVPIDDTYLVESTMPAEAPKRTYVHQERDDGVT
jgi:hypothetical protein